MDATDILLALIAVILVGIWATIGSANYRLGEIFRTLERISGATPVQLGSLQALIELSKASAINLKYLAESAFGEKHKQFDPRDHTN